jgi:maltose O-acetyltransferase
LGSVDHRSQRERMLAGDLYVADDPMLAEESLRAQRLVRAFNASDPSEPERRRALLEELFGAFGEDSTIVPPIHCDYGSRVHVGARTFVNAGALFLDVAAITLGDDVQVGPNVQFLTPTHPLDPELRRARWEAAEPITVGDNAWLGGGVILLPGVTVGENTVVGAGAVVTKDVPPSVLAVGNPARVIRELGPDSSDQERAR